MGLITMGLIYLVSFGPFVSMAAHMGWNESRAATWAGIVFLPHALLSAKSDAYNRYTTWWIELADPELAASFRESFESGSMAIEL